MWIPTDTYAAGVATRRVDPDVGLVGVWKLGRGISTHDVSKGFVGPGPAKTFTGLFCEHFAAP